MKIDSTEQSKIVIKRETGGVLKSFDDGKFDNKMTHEQRCFALCLFIKEEPWRRIAAYFGVHYRTIQMIKTGPRYKQVRTEYQTLGHDEFLAKYLDAAKIEAYKAWFAENSENIEPIYQHEDPSKPGWRPNANARSHKGSHKKNSIIDGTEVQFDIEFRNEETNDRPGWYVIYNGSMDGPYGTSGKAWDAARVYWNPVQTVTEAKPDDESAAGQRLFDAAKHARAEMETNPSEATVIAFIEAAFDVYTFVDASEGLPKPTAAQMFDRIDWRGFDWTPYYKKLY